MMTEQEILAALAKANEEDGQAEQKPKLYWAVEMVHGTDITTHHIIEAVSLTELGMKVREELIDTEVLVEGGAYESLTKITIQLTEM